MKKTLQNKKGITLIESIVSVAIFAILGLMIFTLLNISNQNLVNARKEESDRAELEQLMTTVEFYNTYGTRFEEKEILKFDDKDRLTVKVTFLVVDYTLSSGTKGTIYVRVVEDGGTTKTYYLEDGRQLSLKF